MADTAKNPAAITAAHSVFLTLADSATTTDYSLNTDEFAGLNKVKAQSVRARLCRTGSYFGSRPQTLANGRLVWPNVRVLRNGGAA